MLIIVLLSKKRETVEEKEKLRAHPDLNQGPADVQSAALTTELCTRMLPGMRGNSTLVARAHCAFGVSGNRVLPRRGYTSRRSFVKVKLK